MCGRDLSYFSGESDLTSLDNCVGLWVITTSLGSSRPPTRSRGPEVPGRGIVVLLWQSIGGHGRHDDVSPPTDLLACWRSGGTEKLSFQTNASQSPALLESRKARPVLQQKRRAWGETNRTKPRRAREGPKPSPGNTRTAAGKPPSAGAVPAGSAPLERSWTSTTDSGSPSTSLRGELGAS